MKRTKGIRTERSRKKLLKGIAVGARYPLAYDDPGFLAATRTTSAQDCERALENGSIDESSVGIFAGNVVGASLDKTTAAFTQQEAANEEILKALGVAEAQQVAYLQAIRKCYEG